MKCLQSTGVKINKALWGPILCNHIHGSVPVFQIVLPGHVRKRNGQDMEFMEKQKQGEWKH